jgi:hypothetical protein
VSEEGQEAGWCERNMEHGSMTLNYCQGTVLSFYHSNVRRGSGVNGRGWREFCSLVRQITPGLPLRLSHLSQMSHLNAVSIHCYSALKSYHLAI